MKKSATFWLGLIIGIFLSIILALLLIIGNVISFDVVSNSKTELQNTSYPNTPIPIGNSITSEDLQITLIDYKFTNIFVSEEGPESPPPGAKYLILDINISNIGDNSSFTPEYDNYYLIHSGKKIKFDRISSEYESIELFPGYEIESRIRAKVPKGVNPESIRVVLRHNNTSYSWSLID